MRSLLCMAEHPPVGIKELDAESLKALAHPLRVRLLAALRLEGPATASALGRRFQETSGATSYHLRQLARHGFVEEEMGRGTARERWWRAAHRGTRWSTSPWREDPATAEASAFLQHSQFAYEQRSVQRWYADQDSWPAAWVDVAASTDLDLRLRPEQLRAMADEVQAVLERYREQEEPEGERIAVFFRAFPQREPLL